jgi:hypothetical protein
LFGFYVEELVSKRNARHADAVRPQILLLIFSCLLVILCVCCSCFLRELTRSGMTIGLGKEIPDAIYKYSQFTPRKTAGGVVPMASAVSLILSDSRFWLLCSLAQLIRSPRNC